jgi:hypothetical protein
VAVAASREERFRPVHSTGEAMVRACLLVFLARPFCTVLRGRCFGVVAPAKQLCCQEVFANKAFFQYCKRMTENTTTLNNRREPRATFLAQSTDHIEPEGDPQSINGVCAGKFNDWVKIQSCQGNSL